jgi:error-prone DNA polymerase
VEPEYVPLWVKSNHSFLEGASHPEELVERAHALGLRALALTDRDGVYGCVKAHVKAKQLGIKLLVGSEITLTLDAASEQRFSVVMLARTRLGYATLCQLVSKGRMREPKGRSLVWLEELREASEDVFVLCAEPSLLALLKPAFGSGLYALCSRHRTEECGERELRLRRRAEELGVEVVATTEVLYHETERRPLQDVLTCIRHGCTLRDAGTRLQENAEHALKSAEDMAQLFADDPAGVARSAAIAEACSFSFDDVRYRYPCEELPNGLSENERLRELTFTGAARRYPEGVPPEIHEQLVRELSIIHDLDYGGYFLTMYEIVNFCASVGILCQGRGSAANSAVCFCLGITAIDPTRVDLLFERFLSRERAEPPDIDLDIEHARREDVIQWVYARYGRRRAAMVANLIRYRARSAVRDVGKVLGIPQTELDGIARMLGHYDSALDASALETAGIDGAQPVFVLLCVLCRQILDFPRHLSIHPGGFLLGHEPVDTLVPIEPASMEGRTVIQWDKYDVEALGLFKVDLLGLGILTAIRHSLALLGEHKGLHLDMARIPAEDGDTYAMISRGDTVGVFQIESRAQMAMLPRLRPSTFYDLVIEVALVRPGPIQGDMVHPYLRRRNGQETVTFPHDSIRRVLQKTLGIPIFQEQVMKLAVVVGGYSPGEADQLRRDMAAWRSEGRIEEHHDKLVGRMVENGIPADFAERVFSQIRGFGEYGFPESHAASFALLAYVTAWLRCHHPEVFLCAMLNAQPMGFYAPATLIEDAARRGVVVLPIDVSHSRFACTLELTDMAPPGTRQGREGARGFARTLAVRMGYRYVKGLGSREETRLEAVPRPVRSIEDFVRKSQLSLAALVALAEAGAFDGLGLTRREALWRVRAAVPAARDALPAQSPLESPALIPLSVSEEVLWDYRAAAHSVRGHPMAALRPWLVERGLPSSEEVRGLRHGTRVEYVGLVICRQRPGTATGVVFLTLEDELGFVNGVIWSQVYERYQRVARTANLLGVRGRVQSAEGVVHLIAEELYVPAPTLAGHRHVSRDFH